MTPCALILPGGLGSITHRLVEILLPKFKERMLGEATVVAIVRARTPCTSPIFTPDNSPPSTPKP